MKRLLSIAVLMSACIQPLASYGSETSDAKLLPALVSTAPALDLCADDSSWYPFTFMDEREFKGLHVDIVTEALRRLGINVRYHPMPWEACINKLKNGVFDGVMSIAHEPEREAFVYYPKGADVRGLAKYRTMAARHVFVTMASDKQEYDGMASSVSQPVRVPMSWTIAKDLTAKGFEVLEATASVEGNLNSLLRDKKGSVMMNYDLYRQLVDGGQWDESLRVHKRMFSVKNYFLGFTKPSSIGENLQKNIWAKIRDVRDDSQLMQTFRKRYLAEH